MHERSFDKRRHKVLIASCIGQSRETVDLSFARVKNITSKRMKEPLTVCFCDVTFLVGLL